MHRLTFKGMLAGAAGIGPGAYRRAPVSRTARTLDRAVSAGRSHRFGSARHHATSIGGDSDQPVVIVNRPSGATNIGTVPSGRRRRLRCWRCRLVVNPALCHEISCNRCALLR